MSQTADFAKQRTFLVSFNLLILYPNKKKGPQSGFFLDFLE